MLRRLLPSDEPQPLSEDLLRSLHAFRLPDAVNVDLQRKSAENDARRAEWKRVREQGDHHAFDRQPGLARQMIADEESEKALRWEFADSTRRVGAFERVNRRFDEVAAEEQRLLDAALNRPASDPKEWDRQLADLGEVSRLRSRLGWAAETVSSHKKFRERHDALKVLHGELLARAQRVERARGVPGDKPKFHWSETDGAIIAALGRRPSNVKENNHATV